MGNCSALIKAIDSYIAKADDDLENLLEEAGFAEANDTVKEIFTLEEKTAEILEAQTAAFDKKLKKIKSSEEITAMIEEFEAEDLTADKISEIYHEEFNTIIPKLSNAYLKKMDNELVVEKIRVRTSTWIDDFTAKLGSWIGEHLMSSIKPVLFYGVQSGESIAEITARIYDKNYHEHYYQARRIAITEVLRAHSVAQQEAIIQNPAVEYKEWKHTGAHKNNPRENHVKMDEVKARKDEPFNLLGADGVLYAPMFPRDPELPASESVNCHCIHRGIVNENILGLSLDERKRLQDEAIAADNSAWKAELDAKNRDKSLTNPANSGIIDIEDNNIKIAESKDVHYIGKIDKNKFARISESITTDEVVLTENQKQHIIDNRLETYERYKDELQTIITNPDFILKDPKHEDTALIIKKYKNNAVAVLKLSTETKDKKNSIITLWEIKEARLNRYLLTHEIVYTK